MAEMPGGTAYDEGTSAQQTIDGGYVIAGYTYSNDGNVTGWHGASDVWVVKLNNVGNIEWQKTLGGSNNDFASSGIGARAVIEQTSDGGFIVGTQTNSNDGDVTGNHGDFDYWLVKLDTAGGLQWQKCYGGSAEEVFMDLHQTMDGGYIIAGRSSSVDGDVLVNNSVFGGNWIVKTNSAGSIEWQTTFIFSDTSDHSGNGTIGVSSIIQESNGGYVTAGTIYYTGYLYFYCTTIIDSAGNIILHHPYSNSLSSYNFCYSIKPAGTNGYLLAGNSFPSGHHFYVVRGGGGGNWSFDSDNNFTDVFCRSAIQTSDGGCVIIGTSMGDSSCSPDPYQFRIIKLDGVLSISENDIVRSVTAYFAASNILSLEIPSSQSANLRLAVSDITGRILYENKLAVIAGTNQKEICVGDLAKGIYIVTLCSDEGSRSVKLIKE